MEHGEYGRRWYALLSPPDQGEYGERWSALLSLLTRGNMERDGLLSCPPLTRGRGGGRGGLSDGSFIFQMEPASTPGSDILLFKLNIK